MTTIPSFFASLELLVAIRPPNNSMQRTVLRAAADAERSPGLARRPSSRK
ncbi:MAG: hypothetical protein HYY93_08275 [Planctomycetes bacterium]|nr:hypothetical protein [Planctomycetota bacterium]